MEYAAFAFGIFGLFAFLELSSLKGRISKLEEQLTKTEGTSYHLSRQELLRAARSYVGKSVILLELWQLEARHQHHRRR